MEPIPVIIENETIMVPKLQVQQMISLACEVHEQKRDLLIKDLDDSGAEPATRLDSLKQFRDEEVQTLSLIRSAFSVEGAVKIIATAMGGEFPTQFSNISPDQISVIAAGCLGVEIEKTEDGESEPGK